MSSLLSQLSAQDIAILMGLAAALSWGVADFLARFAGLRAGIFKSVFHGQIVGVAALAALVFTAGPIPQASIWAWSAATSAGIIGLGATLALYAAVTKGRLSVVAPLIATYGAIGALLSAFSGEVLTLAAAAGLAATALGALLVARPSEQHVESSPAHSGVGWALASALGFALQFWLQGRFAAPELGPLIPLLIYHSASLGILVLVAIGQKRSLGLQSLAQTTLVYAVAIIAVMGYIAMSAGLQTGAIAAVSVVSSLQSGVTVLLGAIFLKDRLNRLQAIGAITVIAGLMLIQTG